MTNTDEAPWANENSMLYWWPKIQKLDVPKPRTLIYLIPEKVRGELASENMRTLDMDAVKAVARKLGGYPLFMRTDLSSGKHSWKRTCFVENESELKDHIFELLCDNMMSGLVGLPFRALVFRMYIPMDTLFTAFHGDMPVNPEIRFFARDGKIECWHWYWVKDAIRHASKPDWKELLEEAEKKFSSAELADLLKAAQTVAAEFKGYWSIDFCRAKDKTWILIDMAKGEESYHVPTCPRKEGIK